MNKPVLVLELLKWAAAESSCPDTGRLLAALNGDNQCQFLWVIDAGLGPLLYHATKNHFDRVPPAWRDTLLSAELTAQVRHAAMIDTANEVIDACTAHGISVTLLKGVSISDQYYPSGHLRPMGDIDVLIAHETYDAVESSMLQADYIRRSDHVFSPTNPHGIPLINPKRGVWVELHTDLFEGTTRSGVFGSSHTADQSLPSIFQGRSVRRLTDELQLLYTAYSWFQDMSRYSIMIRPSSLPPLFDAVHLLKSRRTSLECSALLEPRDNQLPLASLYAMLAYLGRHVPSLCPPVILSRIASAQDLVGAVQLRFIHALLDHWLLAGRPWRLALPPPLPGRYSLRNQLRKRWPTRLLSFP